jgi:hypothetical protein
MARKTSEIKDKKARRKVLMAKIISKISDAMKEYATPASERKLVRKIKKTSKKLSAFVTT